MKRSRQRRTKKVGRPPAGERGQRVKDYPQLSVRLPRDVREKLFALSQIRKKPQWRLIVECIEDHLRNLSEDEQRGIPQILVERKRRTSRSLVPRRPKG